MSDVVVKRIEEIPPYTGPYERPGIRFRYAGKALGVTAWGMNVLELAAGCTSYPEHDHVGDGQEEVYVLLRGTATLRAGDGEHPLDAGDMVRVGPATKRMIVPGPDGCTVLAIGATPGKAYSSEQGV